MTSDPADHNRPMHSARVVRRRTTAALIVVYLAFVSFESYRLNFNPVGFLWEWQHVRGVLERMWPPNFSLLTRNTGIFESLLDTLSIAFLGTLCGASLALGIALLMASNTSAHPAVRWVLIWLLTLMRAVPMFVIMLMMQVAAGIGAISTVLAIAAGTVGMFGKLFAEDLEAVDAQPIEMLTAVGATRLQTVRYAILPMAMPMLGSHLCYAFDINVRMAIALGVFGGGGIGFDLYLSQRLLRHSDTLAIVLVILALVVVVDKVSDRLRYLLSPQLE